MTVSSRGNWGVVEERGPARRGGCNGRSISWCKHPGTKNKIKYMKEFSRLGVPRDLFHTERTNTVAAGWNLTTITFLCRSARGPADRCHKLPRCDALGAWTQWSFALWGAAAQLSGQGFASSVPFAGCASKSPPRQRRVPIKIDFRSPHTYAFCPNSDLHGRPIFRCYKVELAQSRSVVQKQKKKTLEETPLLGSAKRPTGH